jgi:hypothetical protein
VPGAAPHGFQGAGIDFLLAGCPGCAFLPGAFGFLPKSLTVKRGTPLPFLISIF